MPWPDPLQQLAAHHPLVARRVGEDPVDLAVLDEHPELSELLLWLRQIDVLTAACVRRIGLLDNHAEVQATTGVSLTAWMAIYGRRTNADLRMMRTTVRQLERVPSLKAAFDAGQVSWAQVRSVVLDIQRLPSRFDDVIDAAVGEAIIGAGGAEPDALVRVIRWHINDLRATDDRDRGATGATDEPDEYLGMQPFPDGTGGRFWGEAGAKIWAILDAALNVGAPAPAGATRDGFAGDPTTDQPTNDSRAHLRATGKQRLQRLARLLDATLAGGAATHPHHDPNADDDPDADDDPHADNDPDAASRPSSGDRPQPEGGGPSDRARPSSRPQQQQQDLADWWEQQRGSRPQLIIRAELDMLLDRRHTPASLLTTLLGGTVILNADAARQLLDARGADLRTVILNDTGEVVGIGRRSRVPPGWLRDAVLALHDTCSAPTCTTPARVCELDHATPWHPTRPGDPPGRTDIDQLAPLCRRDNAGKERDGWTATQRADGTRRWHHQRSQATTRTLPATWRPPPNANGPP